MLLQLWQAMLIQWRKEQLINKFITRKLVLYQHPEIQLGNFPRDSGLNYLWNVTAG